MVVELVGRARRRLLSNEILAQGAWAVAAALGGLILLLLLGTQILDWQWLVLLPAAALAAGIYRVLRRLPSPYQTAQLVDTRLGLADTLSTALYFASQECTRSYSASTRAAQAEQAERLSCHVRIERAIPFTMPRAVYAVALLGMVASSLFALRYGLDRRLDLKPPLARVLEQAWHFGEAQQTAVREQARNLPEKRPEREDPLGLALPDGEQKAPGELDVAPDSALDTVGDPNVDPGVQTNPQSASKSKGKSPEAESVPAEGDEGEATEDAKSSAGGESGSPGQQGSGQGKQQQSAAQAPGSSGDKSSLMAKFRDAMSNLLSRMRPQPSGQQQAAAGQNSQPGKQAGKGQKSGPGKQQAGGESSEAQDGQPGDDAQSAENATGKGAGQSSDQASKQPGSGIGRQDGSKDVKLAEQLAAMGKISEIIGKRAANVSGEVTVEVQSSEQQLRTPYSQRNAQHAESSGEISRDEVPVVLQPYVQQYFEQVRKQASERLEPSLAPGKKSPDPAKGPS